MKLTLLLKKPKLQATLKKEREIPKPTTLCMMSHSHQKPQPQQQQQQTLLLSNKFFLMTQQLHQQQQQQHTESSFSSFHTLNKTPYKPQKSSTTSRTTSSTNNKKSSNSGYYSFFGPKIVSSSNTTTTTSHQSYYHHYRHFSNNEEPHHHHSTTQCNCFNVSSSRRWRSGGGGFKLGCSEVSSMATQVESSSSSSSLQSPSEIIRKKKISGQQKKEELEREVSMLQKLLDQEEKIHEILEMMMHNRPNGSTVSIPNFLPPKMKELLSELIMVEAEITKLEYQISQLQSGLKHEQEVTKESSKSTKTWNNNNNNNQVNLLMSNNISNNHHMPSAAIPSPIINKSVHERMAFETKALHFISKAIKGDYALNDFSVNEKSGSVKNSVEQREDKFQEERIVPKKNGMVKPPSPMRDPRHPSPKLRERNSEMYLDLSTRSLLDPLLSEENNNDLKWQPNKLSESIMKCLNFIYVRLLRTSRAMELEKSGPILRSMHSSLSSRSFRVDTLSNPKSSLMMQKEIRQQDPYGTFNTEESIPRDIGPYKNLVIFTASSMDPKFISSPSSIPLLRKLRVLMSNLQTVDLKGLSYQQKLAFWINVYNACIMHGFIQYGVPSTPEKLLALMNKATLNVGGNIINAQAIEHFILRKRATSNIKEVQRKGEWEEKESAVRELYGLESMDPNVIFALCCGTRSSPAVRIYTADGVTSELEKSKLDYLQASILVTSTKRVAFPELLLRNMHDFAVDTDSLVEWVCNQLPTSGTLRKSMVDCFRGHNLKASNIVEKIHYDYEFQYLLTI